VGLGGNSDVGTDMAPGAIALTRMLDAASSSASVRTTESSAAFAAP